MHLLNNLKEIYETSPNNSTDYILSEYILLHINNIDNLTLIDISKETSIAKSVISRYFKKITNGNNYSVFKFSLSLEIQDFSYDHEKIKKSLLLVNNLLKTLDIDFISLNKELKQLAKLILEFEEIIIYGDREKKNYFDHLINYLLIHNKKIRFPSILSLNDHCYLNSKKLLIIVEPSMNLQEFLLKIELSPEINFDFNNSHIKKVFIGKFSLSNNNFLLINIKRYHDFMINDILLNYSSSYIINEIEYHQKKRI